MTRMTIRAGSKYSDRGGCRAKILEILKHPKWSIRAEPDNDVALGLLDKELKFNPKLCAVKIPSEAARVPPIDDAEVMSWGAMQTHGIYKGHKVRVLHSYCTHLYSRRTCNAVLKNFGAKVTQNFICLSQRGYKAPCTRDTGAPAVSGGVLWGLASWGIRRECGKEKFPAIFSYVGSEDNLNFIKKGIEFLLARNYTECDSEESIERPMMIIVPTVTITTTINPTTRKKLMLNEVIEKLNKKI